MGQSVVTIVSVVLIIFLKIKANFKLLLRSYKYSTLSQDAILKYNAHYSKRWNFEALHSYFNEVTIAITQPVHCHIDFKIWRLAPWKLLACAHALSV